MVILMIQYIQKIPLGIYMCVILLILIGLLHTKLLKNVGKCMLMRITTLIVIDVEIMISMEFSLGEKINPDIKTTPIKD